MIKQEYHSIPDFNENLHSKIRELTKRQKSSIDFSKTALIVLDMQNYFFSEDSHAFVPAGKSIIENINSLIKKFEENNSLILFTRHFNTPDKKSMMLRWWRDYIKKESNEFEISDLVKRNNHQIIDKSEYDAFYETDLKNILIKNEIESIVLCGVLTNLCVDSTARSGFINGFEIIVTLDATASYNEDLHKSSLISLSHGIAFIETTNSINGD